jgi:serralysin
VFNALQHQGDARSLIEHAIGGTGSDLILGNEADNALWGNAGADTLEGGSGNDQLHGGQGDDRLYGGPGWDTATYVGRYAEYEFSKGSNGSIIVSDSVGARDGSDILFDVEQFVFGDRVITALDGLCTECRRLDEQQPVPA